MPINEIPRAERKHPRINEKEIGTTFLKLSGTRWRKALASDLAKWKGTHPCIPCYGKSVYTGNPWHPKIVSTPWTFVYSVNSNPTPQPLCNEEVSSSISPLPFAFYNQRNYLSAGESDDIEGNFEKCSETKVSKENGKNTENMSVVGLI